MAKTKTHSSGASHLFALLFFPAFALAVLLPAIPVPVWTARDAVVQVLSALALVWMIFLGWRGSRRDPSRTFSLDIVDLLFLVVLGWFTISAGNSRQPFESSVALRGAFATFCWWFALRAAWRRWPGLFDRFLDLALILGALASVWIIGLTVQARRWHRKPFSRD